MGNFMNLYKTMIIGSGIMGSGIAQVISQAECLVHVIDNDSSSLAKSKDTINTGLEKLLKKNKITKEQKDNIINNQITWSNSLTKTLEENNFDVIIEAVPEVLDLKIKIIDTVNKKNKNIDLVYASNTSSISITKMAKTFSKPENFIGMHFMNPVPIMRLVEKIPDKQTK